MYLILFAVTGLVASVLGRWLAGDRRTGSPRISMGVGLAGALFGGLAGRSVGFRGGEIELAGYLLAVAGGIAALMAYHAFAGRVVPEQPKER